MSALVRKIRQRARMVLIVTGITPRDDNLDVMPIIHRPSRQIATLADAKSARYIVI